MEKMDLKKTLFKRFKTDSAGKVENHYQATNVMMPRRLAKQA